MKRLILISIFLILFSSTGLAVTYYPNSTGSEGWTVGDIEMQNDLAWSTQTALTAAELDTISADDDNYVTGPSEMVTGVQIRFEISEDPSDINNITVLFKGNTTDSDSGEHEFQLYLYNHTAGAWEGPYMTYTGADKGTVNATITVISDFVNSSGDLYAFAGDGAGDGYGVYSNIFYGEAKVDVTAGDSTNPNITLAHPQNTTYSTNILDINYTAQDETGLSSCWWGNSTGNSSIDTTCSNFTQRTFEEGSNLIYVYVNDTAGNLNQTNVTFFVDSANPYGKHISPSNAKQTENMTIIFQVNASDAAELSNVTIYIWDSHNSLVYSNTTNITGTYNQTNWTLTFAFFDVFNWSAKISDSLGNTNWTDESNWSLTILSPYTSGGGSPSLKIGNFTETIEAIEKVASKIPWWVLLLIVIIALMALDRNWRK